MADKRDVDRWKVRLFGASMTPDQIGELLSANPDEVDAIVQALRDLGHLVSEDVGIQKSIKGGNLYNSSGTH